VRRGLLAGLGPISSFASEPSRYLDDEDDYDEEVEDFLKRWPAGNYEFEAHRLGGLAPLESEAYLSHVLAALPEVTAPEEDAVVPFDEPLLIAWDPVTEQYTGEDGTLPTFGDGTATVIEYQVIVNQETPERDEPWIDGGTRRSLMNLPGDVTEITVPAEVLEPGATYEIDILAIEPGVAARRSEPEFLTLDEVLGIHAEQIHALAAWLAPRTATPVPDVSQGGAGVIRRLVPLGEAGVKQRSPAYNGGVRIAQW
jgi:hypothetical protein